MNKHFVQLSKEKYAYLDVGQGEVMLLLHGNMSSSVHYMPLIEQLRDKCRCIAVDLRGFGDSSYNNDYNSIEELADDVAEFMRALSIDSCKVVGWSAGVAVALKLASKHPELVKGLFSIAGASCMGYPVLVKDANYQPILTQAYATKQDMAMDLVQVAPVLQMIATNNIEMMTQVWNAVIYNVNQPSEQDNLMYMKETMKQRCLVDMDWALSTFNMTNTPTLYSEGDGDIDKIQCKCIFACGDKDVTVPRYMTDQNMIALGDKASLIEYTNCGHTPLIDCLEELTSDIIDNFAL